VIARIRFFYIILGAGRCGVSPQWGCLEATAKKMLLAEANVFSKRTIHGFFRGSERVKTS